MTNSLLARVLQHRRGEVKFTCRYRINRLVYYEIFKYVNNCIARETQLKGWSRDKKIALIQSKNPTWRIWQQIGEKRSSRLSRNQIHQNLRNKSRFLAALGMTRETVRWHVL